MEVALLIYFSWDGFRVRVIPRRSERRIGNTTETDSGHPASRQGQPKVTY
jgi:hypothetical protein